MSFKTPLVGGHRGFKRAFPENSLLAFQKAIDANATVIETDLHITKDSMVLVSHDPSTLRVYGENLNILNCTWDQLRHLRTVDDPHEPLITLHQLLTWFVSKSQQKSNLKLMLDIKKSNPLNILNEIKKELLIVNPDMKYWQSKILFGLWTLEFFEKIVTDELFPFCEIVNITISPRIAKQFINYSNTLPQDKSHLKLSSISLVHTASWAPNFIRSFKEPWIDANELGLYLWTVNEPKVMVWAEVLHCTGIITDSPDYAFDIYNQHQFSVLSCATHSSSNDTLQNETQPLLLNSSNESTPLTGSPLLKSTISTSNSLVNHNLKFKFESIFTKAGCVERYKFYLYNVFEFILWYDLMQVGIGKFTVGRAMMALNRFISPL